jgi:hypothetical protein
MIANSGDPVPRDGQAGDGAKTTELNLAEEFREFGKQLAALLQTVRESPRAKEVEQQVTHAMREMERQVNEALATTRERAQAQDWKGTIKGTATTAADETQRGLARGLHALNERMAKTTQDMEQSRSKPPGQGGEDTGEGGGKAA